MKNIYFSGITEIEKNLNEYYEKFNYYKQYDNNVFFNNKIRKIYRFM